MIIRLTLKDALNRHIGDDRLVGILVYLIKATILRPNPINYIHQITVDFH